MPPHTTAMASPAWTSTVSPSAALTRATLISSVPAADRATASPPSTNRTISISTAWSEQVTHSVAGPLTSPAAWQTGAEGPRCSSLCVLIKKRYVQLVVATTGPVDCSRYGGRARIRGAAIRAGRAERRWGMVHHGGVRDGADPRAGELGPQVAAVSEGPTHGDRRAQVSPNVAFGAIRVDP